MTLASSISADLVLLVILLTCALGVIPTATAQSPQRPSPSEQPPRKLVIATFKSHITGNKQQRLDAIRKLIDTAADNAQKQYGRRKLDLIVLPETVLHEAGESAQEKALAIDDPAIVSISRRAQELNSYIVLPVILKESAAGHDVYFNVALLIDRTGKVVGTYRKTHPMTSAPGILENGVTPGDSYPVFTCDFGRLGIQICWDMCYEEGFRALADAGAEIVAIPSASPQTIRPAAVAQTYRYWVVMATPRDNASIYNPIGIVSARTETDDVLVHQIDLSSALVHWSREIENGQAFARAFGDRGGFTWSTREDTGLFWSNDPSTPVAQMLRQLNVPQMDASVESVRQEIEKARKR